ncbi:MAG: S-layer homology domain-containing protein [Armatimonadetes bacterium]|nr:S-layer homology domain-containing protein [Armatimonadota bacterium]
MSLKSTLVKASRSSRRNSALASLCVCALILVAVLVSIVSVALALPMNDVFPDVPASHPYHDAIIDLAGRDIIGGYENGNFGPEDPVTRQQFAKMIVGTGGYSVSENDICPFTDVVKGGDTTLYPDNFVAVCAVHGITTGKTPTTFDPYSNITRYQVISMVVRAADDLQPGLLDSPPTGWTSAAGWENDFTHGANAARAEYGGLLAGLDLSTLVPHGYMTRGEVAQVLYNLLGTLTPTSSTTETGFTTTTTTAASTTSTTEAPGSPIATYSGTGDDVVEIQKPSGPALVWVQGNADSQYFSVKSYGPGDDGPHTYLDLLVSTTTPYQGTLLIDYWYYGDEELTTRLVVSATGPWSIEIRTLGSARTLSTPGYITGSEDEVLLVIGNPDTAHIVGNAQERYFSVKAYYGRTTLYDLLVSTTGTYDGTVMFSKANVELIDVTATGSWSISTKD